MPRYKHLHSDDDSTENGHIRHHEHVQTKAVVNHLSRAIGPLEAVKRMGKTGRTVRMC